MELEKRLIELQDYIYRKVSLDKKLEEASEMYLYLKDKRKELAIKLDRMDVNIRELENKSIIYLWYDLFTSNGKLVSKAEHDYKMYADLLEFIHTEILDLKNKLDKNDDYNEEYKQLLIEKEQLILESEKIKYSDIQNLSVESTKYRNRIRDINEAINAGNHLNTSLKYLVDLLNKSKEWDTFDIFGRGLFLSLAKSSIFKQTEEKVKNLHYLANRFAREVKVINFYMDLMVDVSAIMKFSDYFTNGLYDDIKDKTRVSNTIEYINKGHQIIDEATQNLNLYKEEYLKKLIEIEREKLIIMKN